MHALVRNAAAAGMALALALAAGAAAHSQPSAAGTTYNATRGVALNGYDVVAYFRERRPVKGSPGHSHAWANTTWHFVSAAHRDAFAAAPDQYAPQFGGFCAYGVSRGYAVDIDPDAWSIVDGRLYLNYSPGVQRMWNEDRATHIQRAEANWPAIAAKQASRRPR